MPSHLVPMNSDIFDQWVADAQAVSRMFRFRAGSPWAGLTPDLDPHQAPPSGMTAGSTGLVARPGPAGIGEVLMPDAGFSGVDVANLPLTTDATPAAGAAGNTSINMLAQFDRTTAAGAKASGTEYDGPTLLALVGGDGSTVGSAELWRVKPSDGTWERITYETVTGTPDATKEPKADREVLPDWAVFPAGAPLRGDYTGNINEPVFIWCGLDTEGNGDNVMVYPNTDGASESFEPLVDTTSFSGTFKATTVEHFGGRLYFGNTIEGTNRYRQRIRRTALFTADPLVSNPGAGAFDVRDFSGDLLRLEKLGDLMVAYFTDGTAFIRLSDIATAPDRVQLLRERRGLLGTHAVCSVGAQEHFGIFDDGWFFLDPSGRWTEVGMLNIDGKQVPMWKETFYGLIDMDFRHRTVVSYDGRFVRIAFTRELASGEDPDNQEVWIFDPRGNRVFRDEYPVTVWGEANILQSAAVEWDDAPLTTTTWAQINHTWAFYAARFGLKNLIHGTTAGYVYKHDYGSFTRYDPLTGQDLPSKYDFESIISSGGDPTSQKQARKLWLEYVNTGTSKISIFKMMGDPTDGFVSRPITLNSRGSSGDIDVDFATFNFNASNLGFSFAGTGPIQIRSVMADIMVTENEERTG